MAVGADEAARTPPQRSAFFPGLTQATPPAASPAPAARRRLAAPPTPEPPRARPPAAAALPPELVVSFPAVRSVLWDATPLGECSEGDASADSPPSRGCSDAVPEVELTRRAAHEARELAVAPPPQGAVLRGVWGEREGGRAVLELRSAEAAKGYGAAAVRGPPPVAGEVTVPLELGAATSADAAAPASIALELTRAVVEGVEAVGDAGNGLMQKMVPASARLDVGSGALRVAVGASTAPVALTRINPPRLCRCALADALARGTLRGDARAQSGFVTLDQSRKALPLLESEARAYSAPLVGVWVAGVESEASLLVHAAAVRFACTSALKDKATQQGKFLVLVFAHGCGGAPSCFECSIDEDCSSLVAYVTERDVSAVDAMADGESALLRLTSSAWAAVALQTRLVSKQAVLTPKQLAARAARKGEQAEAARARQRAAEAVRPKYDHAAQAALEREFEERASRDRQQLDAHARGEADTDAGPQPLAQPWTEECAPGGPALPPPHATPYVPSNAVPRIPGEAERAEVGALAAILERFGLRDVEDLSALVFRQQESIAKLQEEVADMRVRLTAATTRAAVAAAPFVPPAASAGVSRPALPPPALQSLEATASVGAARIQDADLDALALNGDEEDEDIESAMMLDPDAIASGDSALGLQSPDTLPTIVYQPLSDDDESDRSDAEDTEDADAPIAGEYVLVGHGSPHADADTAARSDEDAGDVPRITAELEDLDVPAATRAGETESADESSEDH